MPMMSKQKALLDAVYPGAKLKVAISRKVTIAAGQGVEREIIRRIPANEGMADPTYRRHLAGHVWFTLGVVLWLIYGIALMAWPIIIANSITALLAGSVLLMKLKFG